MILELITPEKEVLKEEVDEIIAQTTLGQIAILPNHIPLLTQILPGELIVKKNGKEQFLAVTGGFLEITKEKVTLLADYAIRSEHIEEVAAQKAKDRAEKALAEKGSEQNTALAQSELRRAIAELKVVQRRKHKTL
jgi:F-type H+-transporting ATPase subunit epsilon